MLNRNVKFVSIDQSYAECGIAVFDDNKLISVRKLNFTDIEKLYKTNTGAILKLKKKDKRKLIRRTVEKLIESGAKIVIVERVRTFSAGFISTKTIIALGELIATIIDAVPDDVSVFSVDTRAWKNKSVGASNSKDPKDKKKETIEWAKQKLTNEIRQQMSYRELTDNEADAIGIGFAFINNVSIKEEE